MITLPSSERASTGGSRRLLPRAGARARMRMPVAMMPMMVALAAKTALMCSPVSAKERSAPSTRPSSPQMIASGRFFCSRLARGSPLLFSNIMACSVMDCAGVDLRFGLCLYVHVLQLDQSFTREDDDREIGHFFWRDIFDLFHNFALSACSFNVIGVLIFIGAL